MRRFSGSVVVGVLALLVLASSSRTQAQSDHEAPPSATTDNNQQLPPNPPNWSSYDVNGSGTIDASDCSEMAERPALIPGYANLAEEFGAWINVPNESGIFNWYHDEEARYWMGQRFAEGVKDSSECQVVVAGTPDPGRQMPSAEQLILGSGRDVAVEAVTGTLKKGFELVAEQFGEAFEDMLVESTTMWVQVDSSVGRSDGLATWLQSGQLTRLLVSMVGVCGIVIAAVRLAMTAKGESLAAVGAGMVRVAAVGTFGIWMLNQLLEFGDAWSRAIIESVNVDFSSSTEALMALSPALIFLLSLLGLIAGILQMFFLLARNVAVGVVAGLWQVSAASSISGDASMWRKHTGWLFALVFYKPAAATLYASAFYLLSDEQGGMMAAVSGVMLLIGSVFAGPALVRLITPVTVGGSGGGGVGAGGLAAAVATGAALRTGLNALANRGGSDKEDAGPSGSSTPASNSGGAASMGSATGGGDGGGDAPSGAATGAGPAGQSGGPSGGVSAAGSAADAAVGADAAGGGPTGASQQSGAGADSMSAGSSDGSAGSGPSGVPSSPGSSTSTPAAARSAADQSSSGAGGAAGGSSSGPSGAGAGSSSSGATAAGAAVTAARVAAAQARQAVDRATETDESGPSGSEKQ